MTKIIDFARNIIQQGKIALLVSVLIGTAAAQTALVQTRIAANVSTSSTTTITLVSATGVVAGSTMIFVDREAMGVNSVNGTTLLVTRGYNATVASPHIANAKVLVGPYSSFYAVDPAGGCTATQTLVTPWVNVRNGYQWLCSTVTNSWVPGWNNFDYQQGVTAAVASAAGQVTPSGPLFHITGALAITGFTSAVGMGGTTSDTQGGSFCVVPDGAFTTTATNNIALASTAVVNKLLCFVFDGTNKKYVPTY